MVSGTLERLHSPNLSKVPYEVRTSTLQPPSRKYFSLLYHFGILRLVKHCPLSVNLPKNVTLDGTKTSKKNRFLKYALLLSADTWFGVLFTVISEMVSPDVRSVVIAIFLFLMNNVGGQIPLAIHPLQKAFGLNRALLMIWPGCIATCEYFFRL